MTEVTDLNSYVYEPIDLCAFYEPIFEPPKELVWEWERLRYPFRNTVETKIGNTWYLVETMCGGDESLQEKAKRLIFSCKEAVCS
jgi:hypothetical protein